MPRSSLIVGTADGTRLLGQRWTAEPPARAAVVLAHGVGEHSMRYERLARALNAAGIDVLAVDQRGHGRTAALGGTTLGALGPAGWDGLVADFGLVVRSTHEERPDRPIVVLGHSLGSWVVQQYLLEHSADVVAAVLSGTAALDVVMSAVDPTVELDLAAFNAPFVPARTDFDWLSRDPVEVDDYIADQLCGFGLDPDGMQGMADAATKLTDTTGIRPGLPVYVIAGTADPVNARLTAMQPLLERYRVAGIELTTRWYEDGRHEMFNETNRDQVVADLVSWLDGVLSEA